MQFGQYELLEPIAIGGMAEVFKGRVVAAEGFEKYVAIKRILPDLAADERFVKMLLTEARIHSALSHRNIVQIHDLGISDGGEYFIVLEYVEGYDLRIISEQIGAENKIIPEALSLYIAAEIAEGLHFAHEMRGPDGQPLGLVHRDVTPSNVLISFAGEVKLSDFGLAKRRHDRSVVGSLKGNLVYMSPEQAMQAPLDRRTDIYSLGAMLFEMLTGRRLREITDEIAGWTLVASGVVPSARQLRPHLPAAVERLLDVALAPDPTHRFPDAAAFGAAIREVLGQLNIAVGASDLAALLGALSPPRRPRNIMMEPSKVIRLGPEAQALREAIGAPVTPAPVLSPEVMPPSRRTSEGPMTLRNSTSPPEGARRPPMPIRDPLATPPPTAPLPPARVRGYPPALPSDPDHRAIRKTLSGGVIPPDRTHPREATPVVSSSRSPDKQRSPAPRLRGAGPNPTVGLPRGPLHRTPSYGVKRPSGAVFALGPSGIQKVRPPERPGGLPAPASERPAARQTPVVEPPTGFRQTSSVERPTARPTPIVERPVGRQTPIVERPVVRQTPIVERPVALRQTSSFERPAARETLIVERPSGSHTEARAPIRSSRRGRGALVALVALAIAAAVAVNTYVVPLEVLISWREPASLAISTDPSGAILRLDGVALGGTAPTTVFVHRDRTDHVIEASRPGYRTGREIIRYDKSVGLSYVVRLEKDLASP